MSDSHPDRPRFRRLIGAVVMSVCAVATGAQLESTQHAYPDHGVDPEWDVTRPRGRTVEVDFTTEEGTWMSVDISPDGRWIVFDLLGHIYRVPSSGGEAECLTQDSGIALNFHPRYSPSGDRIAFVSDRGGQNNLWMMNADGSDQVPVFIDAVSRITSPDWMPDGRDIVAVREFPTYSMHRRSARLWRFPVGRPSALPAELAGRTSGTQAYWPSVDPDGNHVFYMQSTFAEPLHGKQRYQHVRRLDLATNADVPLTVPEGKTWYKAPGPTELAPEVSPDGRWLAFARRVPGGVFAYRGHEFRGRTALWLRDLSSGEERILMDPITLDMQDAHGMKNLRILPGYSWASDSASLVLSQGGKLRRVWLKDGHVDTIPFRARVRRVASEQARSTHDISDEPFQARVLRWPSVSADRRTAVFEAVGSIWRMKLPRGEPVRLVPENVQGEQQFTPQLSPDGRHVVYVTWDDGAMGHVWIAPVDGGEPKRLSTEPAQYLYPIWSTDGQAIYVLQSWGITARGLAVGELAHFRRLALRVDGGDAVVIEEDTGPSPISSGPEERLFQLAPRGPGEDTQVILAEGRPHPEPHVLLVSKDPDDPKSIRQHLRFPAADQVAVSPSGDWVAYREDGDIYLTRLRHDQARYEAPMVWKGPVLPEVVKEAPHEKVTRVSSTGGDFPRWSDDHTLTFSSADTINIYNVVTGKLERHAVELRVAQRIPTGTIALENVRVITLAGDRVIDRGTVLIQGSRIECVGDCEASGADHRLDLSGKTVIPGFVDVHAHGYWFGPTPLIGKHLPAPMLYLAYGVTTTLDPAVESLSVFPVAELVQAGRTLGPRMFATGETLMPLSPLTGPATYVDASNAIQRLADNGAISAKIYLTPRRDQRQMLAQAAREAGLSVTNEGADLTYNVGSMLDGDTGFEHPMHHVPMWNDAIQFFARTRTVYSPTLVVASAGTWSEDYFQSRADAWKNEKLRHFLPWPQLVRNVSHARQPKSEYSFPLMAEVVKDLVHAGGYASIGGHGELWGLDSHWDAWVYAETLEPLEALRVASMGGAYMAGLEDDLGSIEPGKLADLMVLNSNPLDDIQNTVDIAYVMKGGVLYDDDTLAEIWPIRQPPPPLPWIDTEIFRTDTRGPDFWDQRGE